MNGATRFLIFIGCLLLCAGGLALIDTSRDRSANGDNDGEMFEAVNWIGTYRFAGGDPPKFDLREIESTILLHDTIKSGCRRVEFGAVKIERETAQVEVFYFSADQRMLPFLYKLILENNSWKIVSVERMWSVSRSGVVRGLRV
jgi:hypothetical protein